VLYMKGMNPGPTIMLEQPQLLYAIFITFFLANLLLIPLGWAAIKLFRRILSVPREVLMPLIVVFCVVGAFAINNSVFGVGIMLVLGVLGYLMEENGFPLAPAILGLVLGGMVEANFMTSMMKSDGDLAAFVERPIAAALGLVTVAAWAWIMVSGLRRLAGGGDRPREPAPP
jgi:putative tricarboxylic transport membrane protein